MRFQWGKFALLAVLAFACARVVRADETDRRVQREYRYGLSEERAGHYQLAVAWYRDVLALEPSFVMAEKHLGNCYYYLGAKTKARRCYNAYLEVHPDDARLRSFADSLGPADAPGDAGDSSHASYAGAITANPVGLLIGLADLQYEQRLNLSSALAYRLELWDLSAGGASLSAFGAGLAYHFYPGKEALHHFFWGPGVSIAEETIKFDDAAVGESASGSGFTFGPSVELGWQWVPFDAWAINLGASASYYLGGVSVKVDGQKASEGISGFSPGGFFSMGYAWH